MRKVYITADFRGGRYHPIRDVYDRQDVAQFLVNSDIKAGLNMQVIEVDLDNLSGQPEEIRRFVDAQLNNRARIIVTRHGDKHSQLIRPQDADRIQLDEGDKMVRID